MDEAARYLCKDVRYCWLMFKYFYPRLKRKGLQEVYDFEMELLPGAHGDGAGRASLSSATTSTRSARNWSGSIAEHRAVGVQARRAGEFPHVQHQRPALDHVRGGQSPATPPTRRPASVLSKGALKSQQLRVLSRTREDEDPPDHHGDAGVPRRPWQPDGRSGCWSGRCCEKLRGTFIEGLDAAAHARPRTGRLPTIHTSFNQHGTKTGRLSSSKPNLQNLPRGIDHPRPLRGGPGLRPDRRRLRPDRASCPGLRGPGAER